MSVINQMLRDLDARVAATTDLPAAPTGKPSAKPQPPVLILGGLALLAAGSAAIYWMLPTAPNNNDAQNATGIARQQAIARTVAVAPAAHNAAQPDIVVSPPKAGAPVRPLATIPARKTAPAPQEQPVSSVSKPLTLAPAHVTGLPVAMEGPAVVKKMTELSPEVEAQQHYDDAQALRRAGKLDAAMGRYRQALDRSPGMTGARIQLAKLLQESGQADAALSLLKMGYEQHADDGLAIAVGRLLADLGQRDDALAWLARGAGGLRPTDHALMGALLSQANRHEEASGAYQRALAADPAQGGWLLGLGLALEAQGRVDEARSAYRKALEYGQFKPEVMRFLRERSGLSQP